MPQSLHIFQKDLRHLWPETLVGLLLLAAFAWSAPYKGIPNPYAGYAAILDAFLHILIPLAWLVIISRLIHDEPLVGDRQFWTSRPYHWAKLLLAKLLYLVVFIYLPFLLMQVYLLKRAGLYPATVIPALLHNLLLLTVILIIPIAAIAAVTTTFARLLLSVLGGVIYVLILVAVAGYFSLDHMLPPHINGVAAALLILLPATALVFQYYTRRTPIARLILIGAPILAVLLFFLTPATALIRGSYPAIPTAGGPRLTPFPLPSQSNQSSRLRLGPHDTVQVGLPFRVEGVDRETDYLIQGVALTLDGPNGVHYISPYLSSIFGSGQVNASPFTLLAVSLPLSVFNQTRTSPVDLHLSLATQHLRSGAVSTWTSTAQPFDIPGHGRCSFSADDPDAAPICNFPFETPSLLYLNTSVAQDCTIPGGPHLPAHQVMGGQPTTLNFDPIVTVRLEPSTGNPQRQGHLCVGTPLNFLQDTEIGKARLEIDDKQIVLDPLAARIPVVQNQSQSESVPDNPQ